MATKNQTTQVQWDNITLGEINNLETFKKVEWTRNIEDLSNAPQNVKKEIVNKYSKVVLTRLHKLEKEMQLRFVQKKDIIQMMFVAAIAQQPMLLVGEPGTAKSLLVSKFCEGLGIGAMGENQQHTYFHYLLHKFTEPDELLGVINLEKLKDKYKPTFERLTEGTIKEAEVIFLDEVFKANSAILNTLLSIINERRVYEGGTIIKTNARLVFGASNEIPPSNQLNELKAFFERFTVRMKSDFVKYKYNHVNSSSDRYSLLEIGWKGEARKLQGGYDPAFTKIEQMACLNDLLLSTWIVTESFGGADNLKQLHPFVDYFHLLVRELSETRPKICTIDDRKFIKLFLLCRTHAFFNGNNPPDLKDLVVFKHIWSDLRNKEQLETNVKQFIESKSKKK